MTHPPAATPSLAGKIKPEDLRLRRPSGDFVPPTVPIHRMRTQGHALEPLAGVAEVGSLQRPEGVWGDAESLLGQGDTRGVRDLLGSIAPTPTDEGHEAHWRYTSYMARAALMDGDIAAAKARLGDARTQPELAVADATLQLAEGQLEQANGRISEALERHPEGLAEHYVLGLLRVAQGRIQEATSALEAVAASDSNHAVARHQLGQLLLNYGDGARAGTLFEMAIAIAPGFVPPALALADMMIQSRQFSDAMGVLSDVAEHAPDVIAPRVMQLRLLLDLGENDMAAELAAGLRKAAPDSVEVLTLWSRAMCFVGKGAEAAAVIDPCIAAATGDERAELLRSRAQLDLMESPPQKQAALRHLAEAAGCATDPSELLLELAQLQLGEGDSIAAAVSLKQMATIKDVDLNLLYTAAVLAKTHRLWACARDLGRDVLQQVLGTPAQAQLEDFLAEIPAAEG